MPGRDYSHKRLRALAHDAAAGLAPDHLGELLAIAHDVEVLEYRMAQVRGLPPAMERAALRPGRVPSEAWRKAAEMVRVALGEATGRAD